MDTQTVMLRRRRRQTEAKQRRGEQRKKTLRRKDYLRDKIKEYEDFTGSEINQEIDRLIPLIRTGPEMDRAQAEISMEAIKHVIETRNLVQEEVSSDQVDQYLRDRAGETDFKPYPDYFDPFFNFKIAEKKEFRENQIPEEERSIDAVSQEKCNPQQFHLSMNQRFLRNLISPETPYQGLLIFHGTGVGKTCAAISIAEQYKDYVKKEDKKMFILSPPAIKEQFRRTIFNSQLAYRHKVTDQGIETIPQCTGDTYLSEIDPIYFRDPLVLKRKANRLINNYYQFMAYDSFANWVDKQEVIASRGYTTPEKQEEAKRDWRKKTFSNNLMIIDEAHRIRINQEGSQKIAPPIIERVVQDADNMTLILMSATPMYNTAAEIVWLLNLLLQNDNRPTISAGQLFGAEGKIEKEQLRQLGNKVRGYVSYLRGEDPYTFPVRLYPDRTIASHRYSSVVQFPNFPEYDLKGEKIPDSDQIRFLTLVQSVMREDQLRLYQTIVAGLEEKDDSGEESTSEGSGVEDGKKGRTQKEDDSAEESELTELAVGYTVLERGMQVSNFVFPPLSDNPLRQYGSRGFRECFEPVSNDSKFRYRETALASFGTFLDLDQLGDYSSKMKSIVEYILHSDGIVYVYSQFIISGVLMLALALEQNGFTKYGEESEQLLDLPRFKKRAGQAHYKKDQVSYVGKTREEHGEETFYPAQYILITGNSKISKNNDQELYQSALANNADGRRIKVILGSPLAGEGVDLKRIREIHVLDPWHHLNKIEQVIGRGIRFCSHADLPLQYRNVTVYLHVAGNPESSDNRETVDYRVYRRGEAKLLEMNQIEFELRRTAVDCLLNKHGNYFPPERFGKLEVVTSQRKTLKISLGDLPNTRSCLFRTSCDFQCHPSIPLEDLPVDLDTYKLSYARDRIQVIIQQLQQLFTIDVIFTLEDIMGYIPMEDPSYLYQALTNLLREKIPLKDQYHRSGYLIFRGGYYLFQPNELNAITIPTYYRRIPLSVKTERVPLIPYLLHTDNIDAAEAEAGAEAAGADLAPVPETLQAHPEEDAYQSVLEQIKNQGIWKDNIYQLCPFWQDISSTVKSRIHTDMVVDHLDNSLLEKVLSVLVSKLLQQQIQNPRYREKIRELVATLDPTEERLFQSIQEYILFQNRDMQHGVRMYRLDYSVRGYRLFSPDAEGFWDYYCMEEAALGELVDATPTFTLCSSMNLDLITASLKKRTLAKKPLARLVGFMESTKKDPQSAPKFKTLDLKKARTRGAICEQVPEKKVIMENIYQVMSPFRPDYRKYQDEKFQVEILKRRQLCQELELMLRYQQLQDPETLWFARLPQAIIYDFIKIKKTGKKKARLSTAV